MGPADLVIEADIGSATTRGRPPDHHWLVRLRRHQRAVIVSHGLTRYQADRLVARLAELLHDEASTSTPPVHGNSPSPQPTSPPASPPTPSTTPTTVCDYGDNYRLEAQLRDFGERPC